MYVSGELTSIHTCDMPHTPRDILRTVHLYSVYVGAYHANVYM